MNKFWAKALSELKAQGACVVVEVVKAEGSTPREEGAKMLVTPRGISSSIGGGTLEWLAMAEAQSLLGKPSACRTIIKSLGPDLGQCCGGRVELLTEVFDAKSLESVREHAAREALGSFTVIRHGRSLNFGADPRTVYLFGAGHVGRALVLALAPLPVTVRWIDPRPDAFPGAAPQNATARNFRVQ